MNRVGQTHTFTAHVNVNAGDGNGFVNAPNGTQISFTIDSGPGGFTTTNPCTTGRRDGLLHDRRLLGRDGCDDGERAHDGDVGGVPLTRNTDGTGVNSGPAVKTWVNARILIAPNATNEVGAPHTFTVTLQKDPARERSSRRRVSTWTSR